MCVCETCYFHLVEYLGNKNKMRVNNKKTTTKQQEQIKREKYIFESKELINVNKNKKKKRSAVLPARATTWRTQQKKNTEKQICSVGFIRKKMKTNTRNHTQTLPHIHTQKIL